MNPGIKYTDSCFTNINFREKCIFFYFWRNMIEMAETTTLGFPGVISILLSDSQRGEGVPSWMFSPQNALRFSRTPFESLECHLNGLKKLTVRNVQKKKLKFSYFLLLPLAIYQNSDKPNRREGRGGC